MARRLLFVATTASLASIVAMSFGAASRESDAALAKCTGMSSCKVCKDCSRCAHCHKGGGTCGKCSKPKGN